MDIYVSTDVETNGPVPGLYSMLSFGSAAYLADKTCISTFTANLEPLPDASESPETMGWWQEHPEAWEASHKDARPPEQVMQEYVAWLNDLPGTPIFVGYPVAFDFMFIQWYLVRFTGSSPFSHAALDIKTLAMALLGKGYGEISKSEMPEHWFDDQQITHHALEDAVAQGLLFCNILAELNSLCQHN